MATPTAPRVMAREDTPAEYRPNQQARLVPSQATNFSNTNDMIPGMGDVQSGNGYSDNGLAKKGDAQDFNTRVRHMHNQMQSKLKQVQKAGSPNMPPQAQIETMEQALTTGRQKPYWNQSVVIKDARKLSRQQDVNITPAPGVPMSPGMSRLMHGARPEVLTGAGRNKGKGDSMWSGQGGRTKTIYAPASPAPDADEPAGISYQSNQKQIMDMQRGVSPVSMEGLGNMISTPIGLASIVAAYWFFFKG